MLGRTLKMTFWVTYDHLGKLIVANLIWTAAILVPGGLAYTALGPLLWGGAGQRDPGAVGAAIVIGVPAAVLALGIVLPVVSVGLAQMIKEFIDTRDGSLKTMFVGMRRYGARAAGLGLAFLFMGVALATSIWFYPTHLTGSLRWPGILLGAIAAWALLFLMLTALFALPALVQKKAGVWATAKLAALLVFDNTFFAVSVGVALLLWTLAGGMPPVFLLVYGVVAVVMTSCAYELLARKYAALARNADAAKAQGHVTRLSVGEDAAAGVRDEDDDYLNRGVRDALFPWKG